MQLSIVDEFWAEMILDNGDIWHVMRRQIGPVGIGEALQLAQNEGLDLPSIEMIDTIWNIADTKISPMPRSFKKWTAAEMNNPVVIEDQKEKITKALNGLEYILVVGEFKDVVRGPNGKIGLYGWHQLNGKPLQPFFGGHSLDWKDYSQGLRLVKKINSA